MPGFKEVQYYLAGLWLLIRMDPAGFRFLDMSDRGVNRSFWAFVWCLPPMGISWLWWREAFLQTDAAAHGCRHAVLFPARAGGGGKLVRAAGAGRAAAAGVQEGRALCIRDRQPSTGWACRFSYINGLLLALVFFVPGAIGIVSMLLLAFMLAQVFAHRKHPRG
jgi:hypothetical protein